MAFNPDEYGNPIEDFIESTNNWYDILPSMDSIGPRPSTANAAWRAWNRSQRKNCNNSGGYYSAGACLLGQAAVDKATEASNSDLSGISNKGQSWLDNNADNIDAEGNFIGELTEAQINTANDINQTKLEDLEAVAEYTGEDIYTQKANEISVLITTIGNYGTTDDDGDGEEGLGELDATTSNADIRQILKDNGYSDEAIKEIFDSEVNNDRFKGNNVLSNALCQIGYSNCSDWSVTAKYPDGTACREGFNKGTYKNGECVIDTSEGTPCEAETEDGKVEGKRGPNGECIPLGSGGGNEGNEGGGGKKCTIQLPFGGGTIEGTEDEYGNCIPDGSGGGGSENDCTVITQENAEECGYEITSDGQLVPIDLGDDPNSYPDYFNCGGGIFAKTEADCPEMEGTGDPCDDPENASLPECVEKSFEDYVKEVGEGVANTARGLYDELGDKITDCVGSPIDCIKKIGSAILGAGGVPSYCTDGSLSDFCTEKGPDEGGPPCWKDCVDFNTPGLPLPNIPLPPGVVDIGTYRDFENAIKTVGHTIGDIIDGNESCGPDGKQECTVGQVLEDLGTWAKEKWEEAISGIDDATADDVLDWLKGILGSVTAGIIWAEIEEEVTNILASYGSENDFDCTTIGREGGVVKTEDECDQCLEGYEEIQGQCQEKEDPITNQGPTAAECASEHREFNEATDIEDSSCGDCLSGWKDEEGVCVDDKTTTPEECGENEVRRGGDPDNDCIEIGVACFSEPGKYSGDDGTIAQGNINSEGFCTRGGDNGTTPTTCEDEFSTNYGEDGDCGPDCVDNYSIKQGDTVCTQDNNTTECPHNNAVAPDCVQCPGNLTIPSFHEDGDCNKPYLNSGKPCGENGEGVFNDRGECLSLTDYCSDYPDDERCSTTGGCPNGSEPQYNDNDTDKDGVVKSGGMWFKYDPCDPNGQVTEVFPCPDGSFVENQNDCGTTQICDNPYATNDGQEGECVFNDCANGAIDPENNCVTCPNGEPTVNGECVTGPEPCQPKGTVLDSGCDGTTFFIRFATGEIDPNTGECGEIYDSVPNFHECVSNGGVCNDPNAVNNGEEGPCECKPGFTKDAEGLCFQSGNVCDNGATVESGCDTCPDGTSVLEYEDNKCPTSTECNDCTCAAYAAANPEECGTTPPPPPPPPPSSGGGGGGGGGMGAFSPFIAGIDYTPQPLPAAPAAPQKDYMAELDSLIKRNLFEGMV